MAKQKKSDEPLVLKQMIKLAGGVDQCAREFYENADQFLMSDALDALEGWLYDIELNIKMNYIKKKKK